MASYSSLIFFLFSMGNYKLHTLLPFISYFILFSNFLMLFKDSLILYSMIVSLLILLSFLILSYFLLSLYRSILSLFSFPREVNYPQFHHSSNYSPSLLLSHTNPSFVPSLLQQLPVPPSVIVSPLVSFDTAVLPPHFFPPPYLLASRGTHPPGHPNYRNTCISIPSSLLIGITFLSSIIKKPSTLTR